MRLKYLAQTWVILTTKFVYFFRLRVTSTMSKPWVSPNMTLSPTVVVGAGNGRLNERNIGIKLKIILLPHYPEIQLTKAKNMKMPWIWVDNDKKQSLFSVTVPLATNSLERCGHRMLQCHQRWHSLPTTSLRA